VKQAEELKWCANEVKPSSNAIDAMAHENASAGQRHLKTLHGSQDTLEKVSSIDMTSYIAARAELEALMQSRLKQNENNCNRDETIVRIG